MDPKFAAIFILFIIGFIVVPTLVLRYRRLELRHQERMVAFERGIPVPPDTVGAPPSIETYQLRGLVWLAVGVGLSVMILFMLPIVAVRSPGEIAGREIQLKDLGYSKEEIRTEMQNEEARFESQRGRVRGLAALGIVPMAVGTAYLIFYRDQRKRFPGAPPAGPVKIG